MFRLGLLPEDSELGRTPYIWLIYSPYSSFIVYLPVVAKTETDWVLSIGGIALFLVLYFTGYWSGDRRILWIIGGITGAIVISFFSSSQSYHYEPPPKGPPL